MLNGSEYEIVKNETSICKCSLDGYIGIEAGNHCVCIKYYGYDCFGNGPNGTVSPSGVKSKNVKKLKFGRCLCNKLLGWLYLTDKCNCGIIYSERLRANLIVDLDVVKQRLFTWNPIFNNPKYTNLIKERIKYFILCFGRRQHIEINLALKILNYLRPIDLFSKNDLEPYWDSEQYLNELLHPEYGSGEIAQMPMLRIGLSNYPKNFNL